MVEHEEPIYIDVVQPEAPRSIGEEHIVCDLILSQQTEWYERPCLIVGSFINYHGGSMNHVFAMILPMHITHWELIYASGHDRFCAVPGHLLPFHRECNAHRCDLLPVPPHPIDVERGDCLIITMGVPEEIWPEEDDEDDATSLLAAPERMHPAFQPAQQSTQETDGSQEEEASTPDSDDWFTIQAFSLQHPPAAGRVNWRSSGLCSALCFCVFLFSCYFVPALAMFQRDIKCRDLVVLKVFQPSRTCQKNVQHVRKWSFSSTFLGVKLPCFKKL